MQRRFGALIIAIGLLTVALLSVRADDARPWAFIPPARPDPPAVKNPGRVRNPIDHFILARLEADDLQLAPEADRQALIRRVTFDLIGLPPTPEEVEAFVNDRSADAYDKLVDRLLASPRHGERWATLWLDLVRFAETDGFKADDVRPEAWRYRDYVIKSLNQDKPYDRFVKEQLAGDELWPDDADARIATGYCRHYPDEFNAVNLEQRRQEVLNDITDTTAQVFLGVTLGCARCHDHKFDPISQDDYYRIQAFFAAVYPRDLPTGPRSEVEKYEASLREWQEKTADLRKQMEELEAPVRKRIEAKKRTRFIEEYQKLLDMPADRRSPLEQQLALMIEKQVDAPQPEMLKAMKPDVREKWEELAKEMASLGKKPVPPPATMAMTDVGPIAPAVHLLKRGDWRKPDKEVSPGFLSVIDNRPAAVTAKSNSTGRRTALAEWLTKPDNPLVARVMANRLWQHHFGRGIVATSGDFGSQGDPPTHPELLDWLATELIRQKWSLKAMHRLMVTSAAYRQSAIADKSALKKDPENRLFSRFNRQRLTGEALRDAMLSVAGSLNLKAGGPGVYPELPPELGVPRGGWPVSADVNERNRRSVYVFAKRNLRYPLFTAFDAPDGNETCTRRHNTTTAPQALMLLNGKMTLDLARTFAGRVLREAGTAPAKVVDRSVRLALGRSPAPDEAKQMLAFLDRQTAELKPRINSKNPPPSPIDVKCDPAFGAAVVDLCHVLLCTNEFLYVD